MSEPKTIILPPTFDTDSYLRERLANAEETNSRVANGLDGFAGFGGLGGPNSVNPFSLPGSVDFPGTQMLSNANTLFANLRWYFLSNFRSVLSEAYVELGLVQTVVDVPVNDAFRGGIDIKTKQLSPEQVEQLQISLDRDDDLQTVATTAKWNRLFGGAGTLILTDQDPRTPLDLAAITEESPLEFRAVDLWELFFDKQNTEGYDPQLQAQEFEYYSYYGEIIHKSRVMRMKGLTAPSFVRPRLRGWGFSVVEILVRSINQYLKATDLAFEVLDEFKLDVYKLKNLVNTLLSPNGATKVRQRVAIANQIKNYQNAIVMDSEDGYEQKQLSFSGLAEVMQQIRMQVASDLRMPITKIFGISAAGFNTGQDDIEVYNGMVESEVRNKVKYQVLRVLEVKCQKLFGMIPDDLSISFKPLRVMSGTDEETVKTGKFNRLLSARQANEITPDQFVDGCNKGQLFDILLDKVDLLSQPEFDPAKESEFLDPHNPKDEMNPGANRPDVRSPKAWEYGGGPKDLKKPSGPPEKPAYPSGDSDGDGVDGGGYVDEVKQPDHPYGVPGESEDRRATESDDPSSREPQRRKQPMPKGVEPNVSPKGEEEQPEQTHWLEEKMPEEELLDHDLQLEKPKKAPKSEDDAPVPRSPKPPVPKAKNPRKTEPPEPAGHPEKTRTNRRVNNNGQPEAQRLMDKWMYSGSKAIKIRGTNRVYTDDYDDDDHNRLWNRILRENPKERGSIAILGFVDRSGSFIEEQRLENLVQEALKRSNGDDQVTRGSSEYTVGDRSQAAVDARTRGGQPGVQIPSKYKSNGKYEDILAKQRRAEGVIAAFKHPLTGKIFTGKSHVEAMDKAELSKDFDAYDTFVHPGFLDTKTGKFYTRLQAEREFGFTKVEQMPKYKSNDNPDFGAPSMLSTAMREAKLRASRQRNAAGHVQFPDGDFDPFTTPSAESDLVRNPGNFFTQPDDRIINPKRPDADLVRRYVVVVGVTAEGGKWVLTGKRRDTGLWVVPGGKVEPDEEWVNAAARELFEETGIQANISQLQQSYVTQRDFVREGHVTRVRMYKLELKDRIPMQTIMDPDAEVSVWRWVPLRESTDELKSWNRHAPVDLVTEVLLRKSRKIR